LKPASRRSRPQREQPLVIVVDALDVPRRLRRANLDRAFGIPRARDRERVGRVLLHEPPHPVVADLQNVPSAAIAPITRCRGRRALPELLPVRKGVE
jgi:hypothetical protein